MSITDRTPTQSGFGHASTGAEVLAQIDLSGKTAIVTVSMDIADLASIRAFATEVTDRLDTLDLLIDNVGIMACPETRVGPG